MQRAVRVLHVDDEEPLLDLTGTFLEREGIDVVSETDARDALERIETEDFDCVVSDYLMPELDGLEFLRKVREYDPDLPFILFTGQGSEEVASDAITSGATDYLRKQSGTDQYRLLANRIRNAAESYRAERELARYEALVETVGDPMYVLEKSGVITTANRAMVEMLGARDEAAVVGIHASEFLAPGDYERGTEIVVDLLDDPDRDSATYEVTVTTADDEHIFAEINVAPLYTEAGEYRATVGVVRDISERKRREQRLLEREAELERYETIVQAIPDEVYTLDTDGHFTSLETAAGQERTHSGHLPEELIGEPVWTVVDEDGLAAGEEVVAELIQSDREKASYEVDVITKDGERLPHENHVALLEDPEDGTIKGSVGVLRDISHRKRRERELERQNQRLEEFAHIASHDLRNPLNVASGRLELAREDVESEHLDIVASHLERMETLIDDTLAMARHGEPVTDPEPIDVASVAAQCWEAVPTENASLEIVDDATIRADPDRFKRVLENLFRNSVEHGSPTPHSPEAREDAVEHGSTSPPSTSSQEDADEQASSSPGSPKARQDAAGASSGEPSIATAPEDAIESDDEEITVQVGTIGDRGFFVEDDGSGIPESARESLFSPGFTTAEEGTGFGLSIVEQIADAHGWEITATASESGGARFEFTEPSGEPN